MIWKKFSVYRTAVTIVILLSQLSTLSAQDPEIQEIEGFLENFPPARREPQGRDLDMDTAASTEFMLGPMKVNFTNDSKSGIKNLKETTVTLEQSASTNIFNNRSRIVFPKPIGVVLSLSLRSNKDKEKHSSEEEENKSSSSENNYSAAEDDDDIMSTTQDKNVTQAKFGTVQNNTSKAFRMLDRLKNLTNSKIKSTVVDVGTNFGQKRIKENKTKLKGYGRGDVISSRILSGNGVKSKPTERPEGNSTSTAASISLAVFIDAKQNKTLVSKAGGHIDHSPPNKPNSDLPKTQAAHITQSRAPAPVVLKVANLEKLRESIANKNEARSSNESVSEEQVGYETRTIVTADQIGGNRPTRMPFHFTTSTIPPFTTTQFQPTINRYNKFHSPHNHIYAPTQDPVAGSQHEDLNVEDFQDFRTANLVFGSKVGSQASTYPPETESSVKRPPSSSPSRSPSPSPSSRSSSPSSKSPSPQSSYSSPKQRSPKPSPPQNNPPAPAPQSASSGVKNSHVRIIDNNNNNDNLPFYKEPGGVFKEHKYNDHDGDSDDESNQINERSPAVKYAPRGQSAQTQTHYKQNAPQYKQQQYQQPPLPPSPGPAYITATQQPLYHQPVPVQPAYHAGYNYQPPAQVQHQHVPQQRNIPYPQQHHQQQPPANTYYQQPQPVAYYPVQQQGYNNPANPTQGFVPVLQPQVYQQPQPIPAPPLQPVYIKNSPVDQYNSYNPPKQENIYKPPPRRHDPSTDDFYGDPLPTTKDTSKLPSSSSKPKRKKPVEDEEEDEGEEDYRTRGDYEPARPPEPPKDYPKRGSSSGRSRNNNKDNDRERYRPSKNKEVDQEEDYEEDEPPPPPPPPRRKQNDYEEDEPPPPPPPPRRKENNYDDRKSRRPDYDDYDNPENDQHHIGDFAQPNNNNHQPLFNDPIPGPNTDFVDLDSNFNSDNNRNGRDRQIRPFNPSPPDYGSIRPSLADNSPNFDHPNIQYPQARGASQNSLHRPEYDPRGFGVGYGPPLRKNLPLDPIYTRTIKQFDEQQQQQQQRRPHQNRGGSDREREPESEDIEEHGNDSPRDGEDRDRHRDERPPPPSRHNSRRNEDEDREEEEEEERPPRRQSNKREEEEPEEEEPPPRRQSNKRQEEEPEEEEPEEEEEETQNKEITPEDVRKSGKQNSNKNQEEEEEEEEEEEPEGKHQPKRRQQERKNQEPKKPPPKKPQQEKSGNLDEDIIGIEREFGGIFEPRGGVPAPPINGGFNG